MGSKSSSKNTTNNKNTNFNNVDYGGGSGGTNGLAKNVNLSESELTVGDVSIISTDHGAVSAGTDVARQANKNMAESVMFLGDRAYDDTEDSREYAKDIFSEATQSVTDVNRDAMRYLNESAERGYSDVENSRDFAERLFNEAGDSVSDAYSGANDSVMSAFKESLQFSGQNTDRALAFAQQSTRSEAGTIAESLTKTVLVGGGVILAGAFILARRG